MVAIPAPSNTIAICVTLGVGVIMIVAASISVSGMRPYGEQAILEQIDHEDSALCSKFGLATAMPQFSDCLIDLADLRQRHVDMLTGWGWL
jgi:hypothetical protein